MLKLRTSPRPQKLLQIIPPSVERAKPADESASLVAPSEVPSLASGVSASRLGSALLVYMLGVTLIITLLPFRFAWPSHLRVMWTGDVIDIVANVLLFMPLGLLYRLATHFSSRHSVFRALAAGIIVSMVIEALQLFEPERYTSVMDVATNGIGAIGGAMAFDWLWQRRAPDARWIGRLFLELPLMGLIYLTIPLLWLTALTAAVSPAWAWLALPLGAYGGMLLGGTLRHVSVHRRDVVSPTRLAGFATAGMCAGMLPALTRAPTATAASAAMAFAVTRFAATPRRGRHAWNRRFEIPVLQSAAPFYALFIGVLVLLPLRGGVGPFSLGAGFAGTADTWDKVEILRFLVRIAALTLLGYMVAEYRGREEGRLRDALPRMLHWTVATATCVECAMGYRAGRGASVAQWSLLMVAGLYGGWLYRLQRDYVVSLRGEGTDDDPPPTEL